MENKVKNEKKAQSAKVSKNEKAIDSANAAAVVKKAAEKDRSTAVKEKNYLYRFQLENSIADKKNKLSAKDEKKKRNKIRRDLKLFANKFFVEKNKEEIKKLSREFISFYKKEYILNDFSLKSLTNVTDELAIQDYERVLKIAKESLTK
jgi:phosphoenolpyruvate synthase/pyruvate phosphate dikinase